MIKKVTELDGCFHYEGSEGSKFSRVLLGLAWPGQRPGFAVVVAEDYFEDPHLKCRHLRALADADESDVQRLFKICLDLRERYQVERILGDMDNEPMMDLLYDFNKSLEGARALNIYDGAFPNDLAYHASLIKNATRFNNKVLHIGDCNMLRGHLSGVSVEDVQGRPADQPAVVALGFVISYCKAYPRDPVRDRIKQISQEEDYNPLTFGLGSGE